MTGGATDLAAPMAADAKVTPGRFASGACLPFLLKILVAASPLTTQANPTREQSKECSERENTAGIALNNLNCDDDDDFPEPELIFALRSTSEALCGFRSLESSREIVIALIEVAGPCAEPLDRMLASLDSDDAPRTTLEWLLSNGVGVPALVSLVTELAPQDVGWELETVRALAREYPDNPGIVISLLRNQVRLKSGEALYLPANTSFPVSAGWGLK